MKENKRVYKHLRQVKIYKEDWKYLWNLKMGLNMKSIADATSYVIEMCKGKEVKK